MIKFAAANFKAMVMQRAATTRGCSEMGHTVIIRSMAVVVKREHKLLLKTSCLSHPLLASLLQQIAQDMGYLWHYLGTLQPGLLPPPPLPCHLYIVSTI